MFTFIISFAVATILAYTLHGAARRFVRNRLRYVDAAQKSIVPWIAGGVTLIAMTPIAAVLPIIGIGTVLTAGLAVGTGVAAGARDIRQGTSPMIYGP